MIRCKNCRFYEGRFCWRVFDKTGKQDDLVFVEDEDVEPCEFAEEPEDL